MTYDMFPTIQPHSHRSEQLDRQKKPGAKLFSVPAAFVVLCFWVFLLPQCSYSSDSDEFSINDLENTDGDWPEDSGFEEDTDKNTNGGEDTNTYDDSDTTMGTDDVCASEAYEAKLTKMPSDIIFILDNSGSMNLEAKWVQENMNGFSQQIAASGVDYRVVAISSYPGDGNGICIDAPLGSGGCPKKDSKFPRFKHMDQQVSSTNGLSLFLTTFPFWMTTLRADSVKHIVIVSDDNSGLPALLFEIALLALKPTFSGYKFHGIFCHSNCKSAANIGSVYKTLVKRTGGVSGDLCLQDFKPVFDKLATAVKDESKISCRISMPKAPPGMKIDQDLLSVRVVDSSGGTVEDIQHVSDSAKCGNGGWHYNDNTAPTQIILCPSTCDWVQKLTDAELTVDSGCLGIIV